VKLEESLLEAFNPMHKHRMVVDLNAKNKLSGELAITNEQNDMLELTLEL
jgi:hypothetical protein